MAIKRWEWLGEPLGLDFANTIRRRGDDYVEHLERGEDLCEWARHERALVPQPRPDVAQARLDDVRAVRDAVFSLLLAATRGEPVPPHVETRINTALAAVPLTPRLRHGAVELVAPAGADPVDELLARAVTHALTLREHPSLAFCDAPGCGQFYLRHRRDQRWCGTACGTRHRVARHAKRNR
jgi:predicted RNA-binding Zn ribbon-like protein